MARSAPWNGPGRVLRLSDGGLGHDDRAIGLFGEPGGTERVEALDALQEGDLVRHRLVPGLVTALGTNWGRLWTDEKRAGPGRAGPSL